jgi:6-phosphogluconolactonase (cycloisomerase 2 family)
MSRYRLTSFLAAAFLLTACHNSGDGDTPATYSVGGTVTGLAGSGLVLQNNGGNNLTVSAPGPFSFSTTLVSGLTYGVTVLTQPSNPTQVCSVASGSGTIPSANVTTVAVTCTTSTFTVGGTVSGLIGTGLVLQNNGGNDLTIDASGNFSFSTAVASGGNYAVTVRTHPNGGSTERCVVTGGSGTVTNAAIGGVSVTCAAPSARFIYVPNQASNSISAYSIDATTGALLELSGSPFAAAPSPTIASADPQGRFLYVAGRGSASTPPVLSAYSIDSSTGALTPLAGSPFALSVASPPANGQVADIGRFLIHPSGLFGYLTIGVPTGRVYGLAINPTNGQLSELPGMPITLGHTLYTGTYAASGSIIYFPHISNGPPIGLVTSYSINQPSGVLTLIGSADIQSRGSTMAVLTPGDAFLLTPNAIFSNVSVMDVEPSAGTMTPVAGSPVALGAGAAPFALTYHGGQNFFYVTDSANPTVFALRLNTTTAAVTAAPGSPYTVGTGTLGPAVLDPVGRFLFVPQRTANAIAAYVINQTNGALTSAPGSPFAAGNSPSAVSDPSGRFLFVSNATSGTVSSYLIHPATGELAVVNTLSTGQSPQLVEMVVQ